MWWANDSKLPLFHQGKIHDFFLILHSAFSIGINLTCCWVLIRLISLRMHLLNFFSYWAKTLCAVACLHLSVPPREWWICVFCWGGGWWCRKGCAEKDVQRLHVLLFMRIFFKILKIMATLQNCRCEDLKFKKVVMLKTSVDLL